jgi:DNA mismatch repair protein MutL
MPIRVLDHHLIDQIAAGEVIERPASIVKELVENSLDAGARSIEVDIEAGGVRLTRVRDDGTGIPADELTLALSRHATSKISCAADLGAIITLGFRGEALPSIASVSRFEIVSRHADAERAASVYVDGGALAELKPAAHPPGTTVEVRDLFYNLPARRKFLRSEVTEQGHIVRLLERLALSRNDVAFRLRHGARTLLDAPALRVMGAAADRLARIVGRDFVERSLEVDHSAGPVRISGWIGTPAAARPTTDLQFWFVNGRAVRDRLLMNAVRLGFRDVLYSGRQPSYVLYLDIDPELVDVNAHPQKLEVRFRDSRQIHDFVFRAVERRLAGTKPAAAWCHRPGMANRNPGPLPAVAVATHVRAAPGAGPRENLLAVREALDAVDRRTRGAVFRAAAGRGAGADPRHLHPGAERSRPGAGGHARRARARVVREDEGAAGPAATQLLLAPITVTLKVDELDALLAHAMTGRRRFRSRTARARHAGGALGAGAAAARGHRGAGARRGRRRGRGRRVASPRRRQRPLLGTIACRSAIHAHRRLTIRR